MCFSLCFPKAKAKNHVEKEQDDKTSSVGNLHTLLAPTLAEVKTRTLLSAAVSAATPF